MITGTDTPENQTSDKDKENTKVDSKEFVDGNLNESTVYSERNETSNGSANTKRKDHSGRVGGKNAINLVRDTHDIQMYLDKLPYESLENKRYERARSYGPG